MIVHSSCTTRSGIRFAPDDEVISENQGQNERVNQEMRRLSSSFNPEANGAVERIEEAKDSLEAAVEGDEVGRDATSIAVDHLFGDLAFGCCESFLREPDSALLLVSDSDEYENLKKKLSEMHILDGLDYLNDETNIMEDDIHSGLLREYAQELKGMLPDSYDEAWNHPDEKFREQ